MGVTRIGIMAQAGRYVLVKQQGSLHLSHVPYGASIQRVPCAGSVVAPVSSVDNGGIVRVVRWCNVQEWAMLGYAVTWTSVLDA
eukprot:2325419-Amphidinium_carterae.1